MLKQIDAYYFECQPRLDATILKALLFGSDPKQSGLKSKSEVLNYSSNAGLLNLNGNKQQIGLLQLMS